MMGLSQSPPAGGKPPGENTLPNGTTPARTNGRRQRRPLDYALPYNRAGNSVIPIRPDTSKAPAVPAWKQYQQTRPTEADLRAWFDAAVTPPRGLAVICGEVSGNLELLDFDAEADTIFPAWCERVEAAAPGLVARLSIVRTPAGGFHVRYRCPDIEIPGNQKLAIDPSKPGKGNTLIETRGEGGYALAPGCPPACHEAGKTYDLHSGPDLTDLPILSIDERSLLVETARSFDRATTEEKTKRQQRSMPSGLRPGDDYNRRGPSWETILAPHGWRLLRSSGATQFWQRPGKDGPGCSATAGHCKSEQGELFYVFSSNAPPFEHETPYSKFGAHAILNHHGDFSAAAKALAAEGYGEQRTHSGGKQGDAQPRPEFQLGDLAIRPGKARRTAGGKLTLPLTVWRADAIAHDFVLSNSHAGQRGAVAELVALLGDGADRHAAAALVTRLIAHASMTVASEAQAEGRTVREKLQEQVPQFLGLKYRTAHGVWSEAQGAELSRGDFCACIPGGLIDAAAGAVDAPRDGEGRVERLRLIRLIKAEMEVLWADLRLTLPMERDGAIGPDSLAAVDFRSAMVRLWTKTQTFEVLKATDTPSGECASRASLVSRVLTQAKDYLDGRRRPEGREKWRPVQRAFDAWWRPWESPEGEPHILLGMRWSLTGQVGIDLPGVKHQAGLSVIGVRYGVLMECPCVTDRLSGGKSRLAILDLDLARELLEQPAEDPPEGDSVTR